MPVLLFDIDGTLLQSNGVGRRCIESALERVVGGTLDTSDVSFSGKTDPQIFRQILTAAREAGLDVSDLDDAHGAFGDVYRNLMRECLPTAHVEALPGAVDLVRRLAANGVPLGLLTGNLRELAYAKVGRIGLGEAEFPFGAFGSDAEDRNALPAVAVERAGRALGREVDPAEVVIIGDTPLDIACARAGGCVAVAVATGRYGMDELGGADVVLDSLESFSLEALSA
ncbi:HAD family hydrolase [Rubrivirga litoralis]|uniref:HAD family hydrolase n=1 Tax=Rubrivirga litoralis TaxID=3075598 RepID=A0ABU3BMM5_9BACT|nr:HAD family hydrolase [Rubrivirga sp. F394]MDT0630526.1 HAD family hydrolase [Rubrivirga sp. F394]